MMKWHPYLFTIPEALLLVYEWAEPAHLCPYWDRCLFSFLRGHRSTLERRPADERRGFSRPEIRHMSISVLDRVTKRELETVDNFGVLTAHVSLPYLSIQLLRRRVNLTSWSSRLTHTCRFEYCRSDRSSIACCILARMSANVFAEYGHVSSDRTSTSSCSSTTSRSSTFSWKLNTCSASLCTYWSSL